MHFRTSETFEPMVRRVPKKHPVRRKARQRDQTSGRGLLLGWVSELRFYTAFRAGTPLPEWLRRVEIASPYQDIRKATDAFAVLRNGTRIRIQIKSSERRKEEFEKKHEGEEFLVIVVNLNESLLALRRRTIYELYKHVKIWHPELLP